MFWVSYVCESCVHPKFLLCMVWYGNVLLILSFLFHGSVRRVASVIRGRMFPSEGVLLHPKKELGGIRDNMFIMILVIPKMDYNDVIGSV